MRFILLRRICIATVGLWVCLLVSFIAVLHLSEVKVHINNRSLDQAFSFERNTNFTRYWAELNLLVGNDTLYPKDLDVDKILETLRTVPITGISRFTKQTSYKWMLELEGGAKAIFKPQILPKQTRLKTACNVGCEHAENEIAGFAINRLLDLRNMPFTTGRILSWEEEIVKVASQEVIDSFYVHPDRICSEAKCLFTNESAKFCFGNGTVPGALMYFLPFEIRAGKKIRYDWKKAGPIPENCLMVPSDTTECENIRKDALYAQDTWLADLTDMHVVDYIMGHRDGEHFILMDADGTMKMNVIFDYGRGLCEDWPRAFDILKSVSSCCKVRKKVYKRLSRLRTNFSSEFVLLTLNDPLYPLLDDIIISSFQGRVGHVLRVIECCIAARSASDVLLDL